MVKNLVWRTGSVSDIGLMRQVQILDKVVKKDMNPSPFPSIRLGSLVWQPVLEKEKLWIQTGWTPFNKLNLNHILLVVEVLCKYIHYMAWTGMVLCHKMTENFENLSEYLRAPNTYILYPYENCPSRGLENADCISPQRVKIPPTKRRVLG